MQQVRAGAGGSQLTQLVHAVGQATQHHLQAAQGGHCIVLAALHRVNGRNDVLLHGLHGL